MPSLRSLVAIALASPLVACVTGPSSRTSAESTGAVSLSGFAQSPGETITIQAVDQNTGNLVTRGTATAATSGYSFTTASGTGYTMYPWSFNASVLPANFWSPQTIAPNLASSQGHLELFAQAGGGNLDTFSQAAMSSVMSSNLDPATAGMRYTDGDSTVLFDQDGVGSGPESSWVNVQGMVSTPPAGGFPQVAWSVGYYTVGGIEVYGLICEPTTAGPQATYPVVIFNHGGWDSTNGGNLNGSVTASGWTTQPAGGPDELGQCLDWAKRGWIVAMSSYRGEAVSISSESAAFTPPPTPWQSGGGIEFCMGEVTDTLALTDLVVNHASAISVGSASSQHTLYPNGQVFMYGYSHGGCVTYRAVEQGAPVTAFSVIEGFTDMRLNYLNWTTNGQPAATAAAAAGATKPGGYYLPDASGVMGYNWRSAHYFASRGDLSIQKFATMPILVFHGDVNYANPVFLDEPAEIAADIGATNIYVGPSNVSPPSSEPCIAGAAGAPLADTMTAPNASCPISFTRMNTGDSCVSGTTVPGELPLCSVVPLQFAPVPGQSVPLHYMVVYHNMNHTNGGLAIKETFNRFAEQNFRFQPGCDGLEGDCATD